MVKVCGVENCKSGCKAERNKKKKLNHRPTTLFEVPKCLNTVQKWRSALSQPLNSNDYLCEMHFKDEDILRDYRISLPDGKILDTPRDRFYLKLGAIPILKNTATDENVSASDSSNTTTSHELINNTTSENTSVDLEQMIIEEIIYNESTGKEHMDEQRYMSGNYSDCSQQISSSAVIDKIMKGANTMENVEVEEQMFTDENRSNTIHPEDNSETFSLATIIKILENQVVPQTWSWSMKLENQTDLNLYYIYITIYR